MPRESSPHLPDRSTASRRMRIAGVAALLAVAAGIGGVAVADVMSVSGSLRAAAAPEQPAAAAPSEPCSDSTLAEADRRRRDIYRAVLAQIGSAPGRTYLLDRPVKDNAHRGYGDAPETDPAFSPPLAACLGSGLLSPGREAPTLVASRSEARTRTSGHRVQVIDGRVLILGPVTAGRSLTVPWREETLWMSESAPEPQRGMTYGLRDGSVSMVQGPSGAWTARENGLWMV